MSLWIKKFIFIYSSFSDLLGGGVSEYVISRIFIKNKMNRNSLALNEDSSLPMSSCINVEHVMERRRWTVWETGKYWSEI